MVHFYGNFGDEDINLDARLMLNTGIAISCSYHDNAHFFSGRVYIYTEKGILLIDEQGCIQFAEVCTSPFGDEIPGPFLEIDKLNLNQPFEGLLNYSDNILKSSGTAQNQLQEFSLILKQFHMLKEDAQRVSN